MADREKVDIYTIPPNFAEQGKWFTGRIAAGNVIEATILSLLLLKILMEIPIENRMRIYLGIIFILPAVIFSVIGVQGERLTLFLFHVFCFLKNRRILTVPSGKYQLERKRRMEKRKRKLMKKGGNENRPGSKRTKKKIERGKNRRETSGKGRESFSDRTEES